ncbi:AmmeMemoRadiSam system radical SAM enzyme [Acidaminococcus timonensis]|uniref:AmmeMemoRadiSam system radical SAM enzyme n=1 Tax=Acidaminococcus TaxID=904 RepID=UPI0026EE156B|nr:AmmeMemoRadiSam system radical SAM enzyme [Acidaminococcus timonensis]
MTTEGKTTCTLCPHHCQLAPGAVGFCRARENVDGTIIDRNYGLLTSLALDPIEKKPLRRFHPGSVILSAGSFGCNLRCPFCQNASISQVGEEAARWKVLPRQLLQLALEYREKAGNIGVAFTYNEPLVGYEYVRDCAKLLKENGLATVLVTNGCIDPAAWQGLLPLVDAANIDLKGFTPEFYEWLQGDLETVKTNIQRAVEAGCHVEVTTLIIPGKNDSDEQMEREAAWLAGLSPDLPLHLSRYFPRWQLTTPATPVPTVYHLANVARKHLKYVYEGNC